MRQFKYFKIRTSLLRNRLLLSFLIIASSCHQVSDFDPNELLPIIKKNGLNWNKGLADQNIELIMGNYDTNAHYIPNIDKALHGKDEIRKYWIETMPVLRDLVLNTHSLEGQKELLYEIGTGSVKLYYDEKVVDTLFFKYTNIWKLQADGSYRVVVDMFNELK